tara:strand:+ start:651 stop:872 length:222 start_codon:yes stop_codon:yes gene_type:complete
MKYLIESGESSLSISKEGKSIELELNGEKIAIQGTDLEDFDNLIGGLSSAIFKNIDGDVPLIKKIQRIWTGTH